MSRSPSTRQKPVSRWRVRLRNELTKSDSDGMVQMSTMNHSAHMGTLVSAR